MEDNTVVVWHNQAPAMINSPVADRFGLKRGQQIQDTALFEQIIEENIAYNRSLTGLRPSQEGEICTTCSS